MLEHGEIENMTTEDNCCTTLRESTSLYMECCDEPLTEVQKAWQQEKINHYNAQTSKIESLMRKGAEILITRGGILLRTTETVPYFDDEGKTLKDTKHVEVNNKNTRNLAMQHRPKSRTSQGSRPDLSASNTAGAMRKVQRQQPQNVRQWKNKIANFQPNGLKPKSSITDPAVINFRRNKKAVDPKSSMTFNLDKETASLRGTRRSKKDRPTKYRTQCYEPALDTKTRKVFSSMKVAAQNNKHVKNSVNSLTAMSQFSNNDSKKVNFALKELEQLPKQKLKPISDQIHGAFRSQNLENMVMYDIDRELCGECGRKISLVGHFGSYLCCWNCRYSTCCSKAITSHVNLFHGKTTTSADYSLGTMIILENEMFCICGFKTSSGNKLAKHLAVNGCSSAYTSEKQAEGAKKEDSLLEKNSEKRTSKVWFDCKDDAVLDSKVKENVSAEEDDGVDLHDSDASIGRRSSAGAIDGNKQADNSKSNNASECDNEEDGNISLPRNKLLLSSTNKELRGSGRKRTADFSSILSNMERHKKLNEMEQNKEAEAAAQSNNDTPAEAEVVHSNNSLGTIESEVSAESSDKQKLSETGAIKEFEAAAQSKSDTPEDGLMEGENLEERKPVPERDNSQAAIAGVALDPGASIEAAFDLPLS